MEDQLTEVNQRLSRDFNSSLGYKPFAALTSGLFLINPIHMNGFYRNKEGRTSITNYWFEYSHSRSLNYVREKVVKLQKCVRSTADYPGKLEVIFG